jgi:hypothetical protein
MSLSSSESDVEGDLMDCGWQYCQKMRVVKVDSPHLGNVEIYLESVEMSHNLTQSDLDDCLRIKLPGVLTTCTLSRNDKIFSKVATSL